MGMLRKTDFNGFHQDIEWFKTFLKSAGITLQRNCPTAKSLEVLKTFADYSSNGRGTLEIDDRKFREQARRGFGIASQIWALQKSSGLQRAVRKHIKVYRGSEVNLLSSEVSRKDRNEAWEILVGCCLSRFCSNVRFAEPDVLATSSGLDLGFPCKVIYSARPDTQVSRIIDGVKQLETSSAAAGYVLVNLSNVINHDLFFLLNPNGDYFSYPSLDEAESLFHNQLIAFHRALEAPVLEYNKRITFDKNANTRRRKTLGILYYAQTLALVNQQAVLLSNALLHPNADAAVRSEYVLEFGSKFNLAAYEMMHR
mgnify:CR=1 FL=1